MTEDKLRTLIADDTPDIRELLRIALEADGRFAVVGEAADGLEAVALAQATQPDVVLLDLSMPRMDGLEAIPEILQVSSSTAIVVLSGFESAMVANEALGRGAHAYLPKGTPPRVISAKLLEVCGAEPSTVAQATPGHREHARRATHDTISTAVHELRNQATVVEGFAEALLAGWDDLEEASRHDYLARVARSARQLRGLVDVLGDLNRIDAQALELFPRTTSLAAVVREIVDDIALSSDRDIEFAVDGDATVQVDPIRIRQVLTNLLANAAKFSPPDKPITVTVRASDSYGEVEVADQGPGVPRGRRDELFQPFSRLGASQPGSGLGLYISREIAAAHGGSLRLAASDRGARFVLRLAVVCEDT